MNRAEIMRYLLEELDDMCLSSAEDELNGDDGCLCDECPFSERCTILMGNGKSPFIDGEEDE